MWEQSLHPVTFPHELVAGVFQQLHGYRTSLMQHSPWGGTGAGTWGTGPPSNSRRGVGGRARLAAGPKQLQAPDLSAPSPKHPLCLKRAQQRREERPFLWHRDVPQVHRNPSLLPWCPASPSCQAFLAQRAGGRREATLDTNWDQSASPESTGTVPRPLIASIQQCCSDQVDTNQSEGGHLKQGPGVPSWGKQ